MNTLTDTDLSEVSGNIKSTDTVKLVLVGDGGTGKTVWCKMMTNKHYDMRYIATMGVSLTDILYSNRVIRVWDVAGQEKCIGLGDGYYIQGKLGMIMCDFSSSLTCSNVYIWYRDVYRVCENIPIVVVANKLDKSTPEGSKTLKIAVNKIKQQFGVVLPVFKISCKLEQSKKTTLKQKLQPDPISSGLNWLLEQLP